MEPINRKSRVLRQRIMQERDPFKRKVLLCYISKTKTVEQITQDYGISMGRLYRWIHTFAEANPEDSPSRPDAMEQYKPLENLPDDPEALKKIIEELHYKVHSRGVMIEVGGEKLWKIYQNRFGSHSEYKVGRDKMEEIVSKYGLTVRKPRKKPKTTDSNHGLPLYPNLVKNLIPM